MVKPASQQPTTWNEDEIASLKADYADLRGTLTEALSKYNPTPGQYKVYSCISTVNERTLIKINLISMLQAREGLVSFLSLPTTIPFTMTTKNTSQSCKLMEDSSQV